MANAASEYVKIVKNMEEMGWEVRRGSGPDSYVVKPPNGRTTTLNLRAAAHGTARTNLEREIRATDYAKCWTAFRLQQETERRRKLDAERTVPTPAQVFTQQPAGTLNTGDPEVAVAAPAIPMGVWYEGTRDRVTIGGRNFEIVGRCQAKAVGPQTKGEAVPADGVDEIMLMDGRILYQCVRSERCGKVFGRAESVISHMRIHGTRTMAAKTDAQKEAAARGGRTAQAAIAERRALLIGDESRSKWLSDLADLMDVAAPVLRQLSTLKVPAPGMSAEDEAEVKRLREQVAKLEAARVPDDELEDLRRKAAKWDTFRNLASDGQ
jgi:hypothetical protein